jgi:hypothetical protein
VPITPFHFGPGLLVRAVAPRHFSFTVFAFSQVVMDLEPIGFFLFTGAPVHPYLHTYVGATAVALASWWAGPKVRAPLLAAWNGRLDPARARWWAWPIEIPRHAAAAGALVGAYSHVAIDSLMHGDIEPFAPFSDASPWLRAVSLGTLHLACVASGLAGLAVLVLRRRLSAQ